MSDDPEKLYREALQRSQEAQGRTRTINTWVGRILIAAAIATLAAFAVEYDGIIRR